MTTEGKDEAYVGGSVDEGFYGIVGKGVTGCSYKGGSGEGDDPGYYDFFSPDPSDGVPAAGGAYA